MRCGLPLAEMALGASAIFALNSALSCDLGDLLFVDVQELDPTIDVKLAYATPENFTDRQLYPSDARALLRAPVARALVAAQRELLALGYRLRVRDAYRPFPIQEIFWRVLPDENYIAKPVREGGVP